MWGRSGRWRRCEGPGRCLPIFSFVHPRKWPPYFCMSPSENRREGHFEGTFWAARAQVGNGRVYCGHATFPGRGDGGGATLQGSQGPIWEHYKGNPGALWQQYDGNPGALGEEFQGTFTAIPGRSEGNFRPLPGYPQGPEAYIFTWGRAKKGSRARTKKS